MANQAQSSGGVAGGGGGNITALTARVVILENNVYKVAYFASVNAASGTITIPTGATILTDQFPGGVDALVSTISVGQPTGINPVTGGGTTVDVTSFDALGNFVLNGTPSAFPVAIIYQLSIAAKDWSNLTTANILEYEAILGVQTVAGTSNRISVTGTPQLPIIDISASYVGQSSITTVGTIGTGTWNGIAIDAAHGGTGIASYAIGDLLYASGATTLSKLADVATGNALISGGITTAPSWGKIGLTTHISGTLPVANGGTNITSYAVGDLIYASGATALSSLADVAAGSYLRSGGVTTAPVWSTLILPNAATINQIVYASSTNIYGANILLTFDGTIFTANALKTNGSGAYIGLSPATANDVLYLKGAVNGNFELIVENTNNGTAAQANTRVKNDAGKLAQLGVYGSGNTGYGAIIANSAYIYGTGVALTIMQDASGPINFCTGSSSPAAIRGNISATGTWFIGGSTAATALLHLGAGTATASTAPLKFTTGTALSTTEAGAMEFHSSHLWFTVANSGTRYQLDQQGVSNYAHTIFTPTTGGTVTTVVNQYNIINPAGALLALTINLPSTPSNNDVVFLKYTQNITTVTYANGTVVDGITAPTAGGLVVLVYDSGTTSWY